jgi:CRP-like cAMP-binding protein
VTILSNSGAARSGTRSLDSLDARSLAQIVAASRVLRVPAGRKIFRKGDPGDGCYFILEGAVKVTLPMDAGQEVLLAILGRGDVVGEMALLDGLPRSATVTAESEVHALCVPRAAFLEAGGFDESLSTSADWDLHHRIARRRAVGFVPEALVRYRVHGGNMHADVARTAREMLQAYARAFAEDQTLRPVRRRAYGGLHAMLAGSFHAQGRYGAALAHGLRALAHDPTRASRLLGYPLRRWRRRRASR